MPDNIVHTDGSEATGSRVATIGVLAILAGVFALMFPVAMTLAISLGVGLLLVAGGLLHFRELFRSGVKRSVLAAVVGLGYLAVGLVFLFRPLAGAVSLTMALGLVLMLSGAFRLAASLSGEVTERRLLVAISGLCSIALGWMALRHLPATSAWLLGLVAGVDMLFDGIALFGTGRRVRKVTAVRPRVVT